jgi:hypothetical protein
MCSSACHGILNIQNSLMGFMRDALQTSYYQCFSKRKQVMRAATNASVVGACSGAPQVGSLQHVTSAPATDRCIVDTLCCCCCCCCLSAVCTRGNGRASTISSGECTACARGTFNHGTSTNPLDGETRTNWECIDCPTKTFTYTGKDVFVSSTAVKPSSTAADQCVPINVQLVSRGHNSDVTTLLLTVFVTMYHVTNSKLVPACHTR